MAQLTNGNATERKPMRLSEGPQPLNRLSTLLFGPSLFNFQGPESLQNYVLGILERSGLQPLFNERFHFGVGDVDGHFALASHLDYLSITLTNRPPCSSRTDYLAFAKDYELFALFQKLRYRIQASLRAVAR